MYLSRALGSMLCAAYGLMGMTTAAPRSRLTAGGSETREFVQLLRSATPLDPTDVAAAVGVDCNGTVGCGCSRLARSVLRVGFIRRRLVAAATTTLPERLNRLCAVIELLHESKLLYPDEVGRFLTSRNSDLGHARPMVLLRRGEFERVRIAAELLLVRLIGIEPPTSLGDAEDDSCLATGAQHPSITSGMAAAPPLPNGYDNRRIA